MTTDRDPEQDGPLPEELLPAFDAVAPDASMRPQEWLLEHPGRDAELSETEQLWRSTRAPNAGDDWPDLLKRMEAADARHVIAIRPPTEAAPRRWRALARAAAVLLVGGALGQLASRLLGHAPASLERTVVSTPAGAMATLRLPGGVQVHLNAASTLGYRASAKGVTDVQLEGEAYFEVPHDSSREFLVRTSAGTVRDLGTVFDVRARAGGVRVAVVEGTVQLEGARGTVTVAAGQESSAAAGQPPRDPFAADVRAVGAWRQGTLVFIDEPLEDVAAEVGRHFGVPFRVTRTVRARRITATIRTRRSEDAARAICAALAAQCQEGKEGWLISAQP